MLLLGAIAAGAVALVADPGPEGVRQAENRWSEAFMTGDRAYLDALLDPAYVSVGGTGEPHDKATVIAAAERYAATHPGAHATPMPPTSTIDVKGATAVVRHRSATDISADVFYYQGGRWRAWYSQHTAVKPAG